MRPARPARAARTPRRPRPAPDSCPRAARVSPLARRTQGSIPHLPRPAARRGGALRPARPASLAHPRAARAPRPTRAPAPPACRRWRGAHRAAFRLSRSAASLGGALRFARRATTPRARAARGFGATYRAEPPKRRKKGAAASALPLWLHLRAPALPRESGWFPPGRLTPRTPRVPRPPAARPLPRVPRRPPWRRFARRAPRAPARLRAGNSPVPRPRPARRGFL